MFSPRLLAVLFFLAVTTALPATDKPSVPRPVTTISEDDIDDSPWFSFPMFGNLFAPLWRLFPSFADIGPKIVADKDKFQVAVNVKDYKKDDLKVKVKGDFILVQGAHEAKHDDRDLFASQFFHTYTLPANSSGADVTAELSQDGFLIVTAPIKDTAGESTKSVDIEVPIVETGKPYQEEKTTTLPALSENEDDRKEPTTPATNKDEVTDKDNSIPHGNEIQP